MPPNAPPPTAAEAAAVARAQPVVENPGLIQPPNRSVDVPAAERLDAAAARNAAAPTTVARPKPFLLDPLL